MQARSSRRAAILFWLLAFAAVALVLPPAVRGVAADRVAAMESWTAARTREWRERDYRRPALWGATLPGSAFARYHQATTQVRGSWSEDDTRMLAALRRHPERITTEAAAAFRQRWAPAVAALREGAHREDARPLWDPTEGFRGRLLPFFASSHIVDLIVLAAHDLRRAGRGQASVELLLDAATAGLDCLGSPMIIEQNNGISILRRAMSGALEGGPLGAMEPAALEALAAGLRRLDAALPAVPRLEGEILSLAHGSLGADPLDQFVSLETSDSWAMLCRYGFSASWARADAVMTLAGIAGDLRAHEGLAWAERDVIVQRHAERLRLRRARNLFLWQASMLSVERHLREELTRIRLLRLAVDVHLRRPLAPLADPLGAGALSVVESGDQVRISSAGVRDKGEPFEMIAVRH